MPQPCRSYSDIHSLVSIRLPPRKRCKIAIRVLTHTKRHVDVKADGLRQRTWHINNYRLRRVATISCTHLLHGAFLLTAAKDIHIRFSCFAIIPCTLDKITSRKKGTFYFLSCLSDYPRNSYRLGSKFSNLVIVMQDASNNRIHSHHYVWRMKIYNLQLGRNQ